MTMKAERDAGERHQSLAPIERPHVAPLVEVPDEEHRRAGALSELDQGMQGPSHRAVHVGVGLAGEHGHHRVQHHEGGSCLHDMLLDPGHVVVAHRPTL
jgi:hypothetical protein